MSEMTTEETPTKKRGRKKAEAKEEWKDAVAASTEQDKKPEELERYTEDLECKLSDTELLAKAQLVAKAAMELSRLEAEKKASGDQFKAKISLKEQEIDDLFDVIREGVEDRPVECVEQIIHATGRVQVVRTDTWEVVSERAATTSERQAKLPGVDNGGARPPADVEKVEVEKDGDKAVTRMTHGWEKSPKEGSEGEDAATDPPLGGYDPTDDGDL